MLYGQASGGSTGWNYSGQRGGLGGSGYSTYGIIVGGDFIESL